MWQKGCCSDQSFLLFLARCGETKTLLLIISGGEQGGCRREQQRSKYYETFAALRLSRMLGLCKAVFRTTTTHFINKHFQSAVSLSVILSQVIPMLRIPGPDCGMQGDFNWTAPASSPPCPPRMGTSLFWLILYRLYQYLPYLSARAFCPPPDNVVRFNKTTFYALRNTVFRICHNNGVVFADYLESQFHQVGGRMKFLQVDIYFIFANIQPT